MISFLCVSARHSPDHPRVEGRSPSNPVARLDKVKRIQGPSPDRGSEIICNRSCYSQGCSPLVLRMSGKPRDTAQIDGFYASLYGDLRRLAHQRLLRNEAITLLNTTALVHESYLKFLAAGRLNISDPAAVLGYAAPVM